MKWADLLFSIRESYLPSIKGTRKLISSCYETLIFIFSPYAVQVSDMGTLVVDEICVKTVWGWKRMVGKRQSHVFDLSSVFHCISVCSTGSEGTGHCWCVCLAPLSLSPSHSVFKMTACLSFYVPVRCRGTHTAHKVYNHREGCEETAERAL